MNRFTRLTERIAGYEQDVQLAAAHPKPQEGFVGITILDQPYADKEAAGKAILGVCTKMTGSDYQRENYRNSWKFHGS